MARNYALAYFLTIAGLHGASEAADRSVQMCDLFRCTDILQHYIPVKSLLAFASQFDVDCTEYTDIASDDDASTAVNYECDAKLYGLILDNNILSQKNHTIPKTMVDAWALDLGVKSTSVRDRVARLRHCFNTSGRLASKANPCRRKKSPRVCTLVSEIVKAYRTEVVEVRFRFA